MHNCKSTSSSLIDLALDETVVRAPSAAQSRELARLLVELKACSACRAEYLSLRRTLSVVDRATQSAVPAESFWPGYHSRLSQRLHQAAAAESPASRFQPRASVAVWLTLRRMAGASVRIPVPAAALMVLFFGVLMVLLMQTRSQAKLDQLTPSPVVVAKTVEVPVVQEKVVTRFVYMAKNRRLGAARPDRDGARNSAVSSAALNQESKELSGKTAVNLSDFKPTDQVKLTIIKGSYHDQH